MNSSLNKFAVRSTWICPVAGGDASAMIEDGVIVVQDGLINKVCKYSEWNDDRTDFPLIDLKERLIIPGFVNCHTHAGMSVLRGFADDMRLDDWLENAVWPAEAEFVSPSFVELGTKLSVYEMLRSGTTTFLDQYFYTPVAIAVSELAGIRIACGEPILDVRDGLLSQKIERAFFTAGHILNEHDPNFVIPVINTHAVYTVPEEGLIAVKSRLTGSLRVNIHLHESTHECDNYADVHCGKSAMETLIDVGLFNSNLIAAHCVCLSELEKQLLATHKVNVVHCPKSNQKLASGVCPVQDLLNMGVNVALGTDGACSNNGLSMISEMQSAALLAKSLGDATAVNCRTVLQMATYNGAKALGMEAKIGSLEVGKFADFVAIDLTAIECQPVFDPLSALVYTNGAMVDRVWIHGRPVVENGKVLVDLDLSMEKLKTLTDELIEFKQFKRTPLR